MKNPIEIIKEKIKKDGKYNLYEQGVRVTKTFADEIGNTIIGSGRADNLFNQVAHLQATIEIIKVAEGFSSEDLANKVGEILGIETVKEVEEVPKKATPAKTSTVQKRR